MSGLSSRVTTRGVGYIHSTPLPLCPHLGWALEGVLDTRVSLDWTAQPAQPGTVRAEFAWTGAVGTGAELASALRGWDGLRFEVVEEASRGSDGARWTYTPALGMHHSPVLSTGDVALHENVVKHALASVGTDPGTLRQLLDRALGTHWDTELEPFRYAGDGAPVRWLHKVG